jgi:hypothetical protein
VHDYGCEECGVVGWRRDGEAIVQTGEENGVPVVSRVAHGEGSGSWMAECGHRVREGSALERFFNGLAPGQAGALPRNT